MDTPLFTIFDIMITPWKLIGYLGVFMFTGRWVVQVLATRRRRRPVIPTFFWTMSIIGSGLLLAYFIWGKNDSVGVLSNLFPMTVAVYNLMMARHARSMQGPASLEAQPAPQAGREMRGEAQALADAAQRASRRPSRTPSPSITVRPCRTTVHAGRRPHA
ncbi:MAG TPA: lipid-A-disaccharide synthase N-terminal domain-containing protein [Steroidobacter sp.]|nr:lipid-A-disaccharide synthase N-terminal domain-containing protein [Steroidobacter sp.]